MQSISFRAILKPQDYNKNVVFIDPDQVNLIHTGSEINGKPTTIMKHQTTAKSPSMDHLHL